MKKRILALVMAVSLIVSMSVITVSAETISADTSWYDVGLSEFTITTAAQLAGLASLVDDGTTFEGQTVKLGNDIALNTGDASTWATTAPENEWNPIGTDSKSFAGTFDGQDKTISGMYINTASRWSGLFATTANGAKVCNLKLKNSYIKSSVADVGSIAGIGRGTFDTVYSDAIIDCLGERSGGLLGQASGTDTVMTSCWFDGTFTTSGAGKQAVGGLVGVVTNNAKLTVTSCHVSGTVDATACGTTQPYAGGLVGRVGMGQSAELVMSDSLVTGLLITNTGVTTGFGAGVGMVSVNATSTISKVYFTAESSTRSIAVANGSTYTGTPVKVTGSILGAAAKTSMPNLSWDTAWTTVTDGIPMLLAFAAEVPADPTAPDTRWLSAAQGTQADPYLIADMGDLYGLSSLAADNNFAGKYFRLTADIALNTGDAATWATTAPANSWTPIGKQTKPFAGIFDGQNHTISGMYLNTTSRWVGLFSATADGAAVRNLNLKNSYIKTTVADVGSIAGIGRGTFDKVYSDTIIDCEGARSGGMLGQAAGTDTVMTNCWFAGSITDSGVDMQGIGGLVGIVLNDAKLTLTGCFNSGTVDVTACGDTKQPFAGGLVGQVGQGTGGELVMSDSLVTGLLKTNTAITAGYGAGVGMVSANASSTITRLSSVYYLPETSGRSISVAKGAVYTGVPVQAKGSIVGADAYANMPGLDYETWWFVEDGETPIPTAYATQAALENEAVGKFAAVSASGTETLVNTFEEACAGAYVKLITNAPITLTADTVVDVNNRTVTINNDDYMLSILDSNSDNFGEEKAKVTVTDEDNLNVIAAKPGTADQYVALKNEDGTYTPHWLYVKLTTASLKANNSSVSIYYKSSIKADSALTDYITAYGIAASLSEIPEDFRNEAAVGYTVQEFEAPEEGDIDFTGVSGIISNVLQKNRQDPDLDTCGKYPIFASAYVTVEIGGETYDVMGVASSNFSLYDLMCKLNDAYDGGVAPDNVKALVANWDDPMSTWGLDNLQG